MTETIPVSAEAQALFDDALVWDMVVPIHSELGNDFSVLEYYKECGFNFASFTIAGDDYDISGTMKRMGDVRAQLQENEDKYVFVHSADDVVRAKHEGKLAVGLHFEGTRCMDRDPHMVEIYYALGVRHNLLAFNKNNSAAGGCGDLHDSGLTRYGQMLVDEMNRVGMLVDLSHTGYKTTLDIMERITDPVIVSHSNVYALHPHYRNLRDDQILKVAETGGVIGLSGFSAYLGDPDCKTETAFRHVDHIVQLVGDNHMALGLDYFREPEMLRAYMATRPEEWPKVNGVGYDVLNLFTPARVPELVQMMLDNGYKEESVRRILGLNWLRVAKEVWK